MIKILFFDFDGTISDAYKLSYNSMISIFEKNNLKINKRKLKKN